MQKTAFLIAAIFLISGKLLAQLAIEVPSQIRFADMRLNLTPEARKKIQTDVDALIRHEKYFNAKVDKVDAHLPIIEQVLREEDVPDDIKYLVIQESALVGDAVSTSDAVGYWQFKEATGLEVGLTINREVDERMNIVTATRGAAQYFKNNNTFFDNWLYALLAYYAGPGGALKIADKKYYGKREMKLDGSTHWYVIKYLAHKIAFENAVNRNPNPEMVLFTFTEGNGKTLAQVAAEFDLQESDLEPYNRWVRKIRIPDDKLYYVIIPDYSGRVDQPLLARKPEPTQTGDQVRTVRRSSADESQEKEFVKVDDTDRFPVVRKATRWGEKVTLVNGIPGVIARQGDNIRAISQRTDVQPSKLVRFNDLTSQQSTVSAGMPYYLKRKRNKGATHYHVVEPGETLWSISQRFGIRLNKLMRNNRMEKEQELRAGRVLWLRFIRPPQIPIEYRDVPAAKDSPPLSSRPEKKRPVAVRSQVVNPEAAASQDKKPVSSTYESSSEMRAGSTNGNEVDISQVSSDESPEPAKEKPRWSEPIPAPQEEVSAESVPVEKEQELVPVLSESNTGNKSKNHHIVQAGETLYSIARHYDLTIPQLTSYNNIDWEVPLSVGQRLMLVPTGESVSSSGSGKQNSGKQFSVHKVTSGETLYSIARQYNITIKDLMDWNNKEDFNVRIGEELRLQKK